MKIQIISKKIDQKVLLELTNAWFKSFVKFVVDIKTGQLAVGGELHSDAELLLLENGAEKSDLWVEIFSQINFPSSELNLHL